jgi:hypothetical protein
LHDYLLNVPAALSIDVTNREQRVQALGPSLADTDQYPRGERYPQLTREVEGSNPSRGPFGFASMMRRVRGVYQSVAGRLEHQTLARAHPP